ncbi:hypothetical protein ABZP36_000256 [Zizania latifolia]
MGESAVQECVVDASGEITYNAIDADHVPGSKALDRPDAIANTYSRGCEASKECRGGLGYPTIALGGIETIVVIVGVEVMDWH